MPVEVLDSCFQIIVCILFTENVYIRTQRNSSYWFLARLRYPRLAVSDYAKFVKRFILSEHEANEV